MIAFIATIQLFARHRVDYIERERGERERETSECGYKNAKGKKDSAHKKHSMHRQVFSGSAGAVLTGVMQAQSRTHARFRRNGAVLLPVGPGKDSKVRQAVRRGYQHHHLLRAVSGHRDIHLVCSHVVPAGTTHRNLHAGSRNDEVT